jgi:SAM-dependent methyltransferase
MNARTDKRTSMRKIGRDVSAAEYWVNEGQEYQGALQNAYHQHRLGVVRDLIQPFSGSVVIDFGCGDGIMLRDFPHARCIGIEPDAGLLGTARQNFPDAQLHQGSVAQLRDIPSDSADLMLCLNVLAYLSDAEDDLFYRETHRILKPGGLLVVTHSNELFDLFSLNSYTVEFFKTNFGCDPSALLTTAPQPDATTYNIRENPLTYAGKLERYGFHEERQGFINHHALPPLLGPQAETRLDTLNVPESERWKLRFQCSTFGSRSMRI